jgi:ASC-1-like (ASCH) protein
MLEQEGVRAMLPGILDVSQGVDIYRAFYSSTREQQWGMIAMHIAC